MAQDQFGNYVADFTGNDVYVDPTDAGSGGSGSITGTGSPEGVVTASVGIWYYDESSEDIYIKKTGTGNTGWELRLEGP